MYYKQSFELQSSVLAARLNYQETTQGRLMRMSAGEFDWSPAYSLALLFVLRRHGVCVWSVSGPIPLSMALEHVRWLGATVFWGNRKPKLVWWGALAVRVRPALSGAGFSIYFRSLRTKHIYEHT